MAWISFLFSWENISGTWCTIANKEIRVNGISMLEFVEPVSTVWIWFMRRLECDHCWFSAQPYKVFTPHVNSIVMMGVKLSNIFVPKLLCFAATFWLQMKQQLNPTSTCRILSHLLEGHFQSPVNTDNVYIQPELIRP